MTKKYTNNDYLSIDSCKDETDDFNFKWTSKIRKQGSGNLWFLGSKYQIIPRKSVVYYIENIKLKKNAIYCKEPSIVQIKCFVFNKNVKDDII